MSRYDSGFVGRFEGLFSFSEGELFDRVDGMIGDVVSDEFIWRWISGLMDVNDYKFVMGERLKVELRLFWVEEKK